jgi:hypothetical protein
MRRWLVPPAMIVLSALMMTSGSLAQTSVSGSIAADTQWTLEGAPYIVDGDVVVQNAATLRIEPGVTVYMAQNASLAVQSGSIRAEGRAADPIRVLSDKARQEGAGSAGDWKHWVFTPGTSSTLLEHVIFEHGSGLIVRGSAPVFNYVQVLNQSGPAIEVDLSASLSGIGNQASGNMLNGILVPPGDIHNNVKWGLRGIPYIVASGAVSVGASPVVSNIAPDALRQGETSTFQISGTRLQGLSKARFNVSGLSAQILPGTTDTQAAISVTADEGMAKGFADLFLLVDAGEIHISNALEVIHTQPQITKVLSPGPLDQGQSTVEVVVRGQNFTDQSVIVVDGHDVPTRYVSTTQLVATIAIPENPGALVVALKLQLKAPDPEQAGQFLVSNEVTLQLVFSIDGKAPAAANLEAYDAAFTAFGGSGTVTWSIVSGSLPAGLHLVPEGSTATRITGVPNDTVGNYTAVIRAAFSSGEMNYWAIDIALGTYSVLLHFDGINDGTAFTDETGRAWSRTGSVVTSTAQSVLGGASYYASAAGKYIQTPYSSVFDLSASDFTIEGWLRPTGNSGSSRYGTVISKRSTGIDFDWVLFIDQGNRNIDLAYGNTSTGRVDFASALNTVPANIWTHVAIVRKGGQLMMYINGVENTRQTISGSIRNRNLPVYIGMSNSYSDSYWIGWLDEFRIVKGAAMYNGNFTPPAIAFTYPQPAPALAINGSLPAGAEGVAYSSVTDIAIKGEGTPFATVSVTSGAMPPSWTATVNGNHVEITGQGVAAGDYTFTLTVMDNAGNQASLPVTVHII